MSHEELMLMAMHTLQEFWGMRVIRYKGQFCLEIAGFTVTTYGNYYSITFDGKTHLASRCGELDDLLRSLTFGERR
jgi:hypothetical protein